MNNKRILITGGNGFIGSHLVKRIVALGHKPTLILRKNSDRSRLAGHLDKVTIAEADLSNFGDVKNIVQNERPQIVFHLGAYGVYSYVNLDHKNAKATINANIYGTINLLYAVKDSNCEMVINTGSCFEYGSKPDPFKEDEVLHPCNLYGISKVATTLFAANFSKHSGLPIITLRPFTAFGPRQDEKRFIATAIRQCLANKEIKLTKGKTVRDYIYIDDVVDGYLRAATVDKKLAGETINISTGIGYRLTDLARLVIKLTKAKTKINIGAFPTRPGEVIELIGSAEKAKKVLGWQAKYSLEEGLRKTIVWQKTFNS